LKGRKPKPGKSVKERQHIRSGSNAKDRGSLTIIPIDVPQKDNEIERNIRFVEEHKSFLCKATKK